MSERLALRGAAGACHRFSASSRLPLVVMGKAIGADIPHACRNLAVAPWALPISLS